MAFKNFFSRNDHLYSDGSAVILNDFELIVPPPKAIPRNKDNIRAACEASVRNSRVISTYTIPSMVEGKAIPMNWISTHPTNTTYRLLVW